MNDLRLREITLSNFRSYTHLHLKDLADTVVIVGPNAIGKTNIIEAIQMTTALQSFRAHSTHEMIRWGADQGSVRSHISGNSRDIDIELTLHPKRRVYKLNGNLRTIHDLQGILPAVTFCPDDLQLVKSSDALRRQSIDAIACQLSKNYQRVHHDYYSLVRQKNKALKDDVNDTYIQSINDVLVRVGIQFVRLRNIMVQKICQFLNDYYDDISNDHMKLQLIYIPSWMNMLTQPPYTTDDAFNRNKNYSQSLYEFNKERDYRAFCQELKRLMPEERTHKRCLVGPHLDHVKFFLQDHDASHFASQGQQRSIALAYKFSEVSAMKETLDQTPLLLLDDVMSELDEDRRSKLIQFAQKDIQTFITSTSTQIIPASVIHSSQIIHLPLEQ